MVDFSKACTLEDHTQAGIQRCTFQDLEREIRLLKYMLDFEDSREHEQAAAQLPVPLRAAHDEGAEKVCMSAGTSLESR